jgi:hypothetical protein
VTCLEFRFSFVVFAQDLKLYNFIAATIGSFYLENIFVVVAAHHLDAMYTALSMNPPLEKHFFKKQKTQTIVEIEFIDHQHIRSQK